MATKTTAKATLNIEFDDNKWTKYINLKDIEDYIRVSLESITYTGKVNIDD